MHRVLFRRQRLDALVTAAHRCAFLGLMMLGAAVAGITVIIFNTVAGTIPALIAGGFALMVFATFWLVLPMGMRRGRPQSEAP
ncbi:MAG: DUF6328 family protein [Mycolicibacterium sp.]|uniref:DUF6328 family protein n=1 Tax=Mycolicibacterium sp. TaxID=2320850 RepID=UPI003D0F67F4